MFLLDVIGIPTALFPLWNHPNSLKCSRLNNSSKMYPLQPTQAVLFISSTHSLSTLHFPTRHDSPSHHSHLLKRITLHHFGVAETPDLQLLLSANPPHTFGGIFSLVLFANVDYKPVLSRDLFLIPRSFTPDEINRQLQCRSYIGIGIYLQLYSHNYFMYDSYGR